MIIKFVVNNEQDSNKQQSSDKKEAHFGRSSEDLDDKEWHVSHLRDLTLTPDDCERTFEEKANKYRETLKNDAALVEFVSRDAIPVNEQVLTRAKCERNISSIFRKNINTKINLNMNTTEAKNIYISNSKVKQDNITNKLSEKVPNVLNATKQRRSDYQFSSVEYYDEVEDFDGSICPNVVDVVTLELDQLRSYDIQCEAIVEWRSLE